MTPALAIYLDIVESNIERTVDLLGGDPERWRPHVKTAKLAAVMERLVAHGVGNFKCAATFELLTVCEAGARDVVVAYPCLGARARRVHRRGGVLQERRQERHERHEDQRVPETPPPPERHERGEERRGRQDGEERAHRVTLREGPARRSRAPAREGSAPRT